MKYEETAKFVDCPGDPEGLQKQIKEEYGFRQQQNSRVLQVSCGSKLLI